MMYMFKITNVEILGLVYMSCFSTITSHYTVTSQTFANDRITFSVDWKITCMHEHAIFLLILQ